MVESARSKFARAVAVHLSCITETAVDAGAGLGGLEKGLRLEFVPALVGPTQSRRTAFRRRCVEVTAEKTFYFPFPGIHVQGV